VVGIKSIELIDSPLYVEDMKIGKIKGIIINPEEWKLTHLEVEITKDAAKEILGANTAVRNKLAISALRKGEECCIDKGVIIKVSKNQKKYIMKNRDKNQKRL
jgi:hypothetical protein